MKINGEEGGGGGSWQTVFEGSVETVDDDGDIFGIIENLTLTGDSIKATLNGTEYILPKTEHGYGAENESGIDFNTYPLFIAIGEDFCNLWTPSAGTYTLKIEEEQSGGSSDFSTAEVTVESVLQSYVMSANLPIIYDDEDVGGFLNCDNMISKSENFSPYTVVLYKGRSMGSLYADDLTISVSGDATFDGEFIFITGDCTITIS